MPEYRPDENKNIITELDPVSTDSYLSIGPAKVLDLVVLSSLGWSNLYRLTRKRGG